MEFVEMLQLYAVMSVIQSYVQKHIFPKFWSCHVTVRTVYEVQFINSPTLQDPYLVSKTTLDAKVVSETEQA
jgi:hypothetical protein